MLAHSGGQNETSTLLSILPTRRMALAIGMNFESSDPGVYLDRLFQFVSGAPFVLYLYSSDRAKSSLHDAINSTFNYGLAHYDHFGKPMTTDPVELAKAFAYFSDAIDLSKIKANPQEATKKIREGVHPAAQQAFTKVGSYMAAKLAEKHGAARLNSYAALGGLPFVEDYLALKRCLNCIRNAGANFAYGVALALSGDSDAGQERLRKSASINPTGNASASGLNNVAYNFANSGMLESGLTLLRIAIDLYPKEANLYDSVGEFYLRKGDKAKGLEFYQKALEVDPNFPNATVARDVVKKLSEELAVKK